LGFFPKFCKLHDILFAKECQVSVFDNLQKIYHENKAAYWVLIDPDKLPAQHMSDFAAGLSEARVDAVLIGGSLILNADFEQFVREIKKHIRDIPVILFPGSVHQVTPTADAMLFLSLISGREAQHLIGDQVRVAPLVYRSQLESIATAYMLIESGKPTSAQFMSGTTPLPRHKPDIVVAHALAAKYLGFKLIYLEGGSGADHSVPDEIISAVAQHVDLPIIVGGGITSPEKAAQKVRAGATFIVTGNILEKSDDPLMVQKFATAVHQADHLLEK
jgi:putative glycerol-1-phosphate prenyltransferase